MARLSVAAVLSAVACATALRAPRVPALYNSADARPIVLFDGECNLCNAGVNLLLDRDRCSADPRGNLRVSALQSDVGQLLLGRLSAGELARTVDAETGEYSSIVVAGSDRAWVGSAAVLKIGRNFGKGRAGVALRALSLAATCVPSLVRDPVYGFLSRRRKSWFGEADQCRLWDDNWDTRFVPDDVLANPPADAAAPPAYAAGDAVVVASSKAVAAGDLIANGLRGVVQKATTPKATVELTADGAAVVADIAVADLRPADA